jgi:CMP-N-acetylneuraminic acid synthetase
MKVLGLITARGGSKGLPGKNLKSLHGKPLLERTAECARAAGVLDRIILSTDSPEIAAVGRRAGVEVPFLRPAQFSADSSPTIAVVTHALQALAQSDEYFPDAVMVLQPTSPLRKPEHIREAIRLLEANPAAESVCGVVPLPKEMCPHYVMKITEEGHLDNFLPEGRQYTRRQDVPQAYKRDGTLYLVRTQTALEKQSLYGDYCIPLIIEAHVSLTIDTLEDWEEAERRLAKAQNLESQSADE